MKRYVQPAAQYALYTFALVWPLQVLVYVPFLNVSLAASLAAVAILLLIADLVYGATLRVPSELLWPVLLLAVIIGAATVFAGDSALASWQSAGALLFFVAAAHFAVSIEVVQRWLVVSAVSVAAASIITLVSPFFGWHATAYSLDSPALLTFAYDLAGGAFILFAGLAFGAAGAFTLPFPGKLVASFAALASAAGLLFLALASRPGWAAWIAPNVFAAPWPVVFAVLAAAWLWARATAKTIRDGFLRRTPWHVALIAVACAGAFWFVVSGHAPGLPAAFILGAAAGITLPGVEPAPRLRFAPALALLAIPLVAINLITVFPAHEADPRNYEAAARADLERGDVNTLERRMFAFERRMPAESRLRLWLARAALARDHPEASVVHMEEALQRADTGGKQMLPPVSEQEQQEWLVRLRDTVLARPADEQGWAYEWALATVGEKDSALYALGLQPVGDTESDASTALQSVLQFMLQLEAPYPPNVGPDSALIDRLAEKGAVVISAPEDVPENLLPIVFAVRPAVAYLDCYVGAGAVAKAGRSTREPAERHRLKAQAAWETPQLLQGADDQWRVEAFVRDGSERWRAAGVAIGSEDGGNVPWPETYAPPVIPYEPLVVVWTRPLP